MTRTLLAAAAALPMLLIFGLLMTRGDAYRQWRAEQQARRVARRYE